MREIARARVYAGLLTVALALAALKLGADVYEWVSFTLGGGR